MTDIETTVENARAQYHYPPIRTALLPSDVDDLQLRLADRLRRDRHQHALEVIADLGQVFDAEEAEPAIEALGRLLVHASLLAGCERMAIAPIIALGRELTRDSGVSSELPLKPAAVLATAVLVPAGDLAGIVRGMAMAIAKALDDCEIVHELKIDPLELFKVAAREVLDGRPAAVVTAPAVQPTQPDKAAQRALAWTELRKASEAIVAEDASGTPLTDEHLDGRIPHAQIVAPTPRRVVGVQYEVAEDGMGGEGQIPIPLYDPPDLYDNKASGPVFGLGEFIPRTGTIEIPPELSPIPTPPSCPVCRAPMSPRADMPWAWSCKDHP